MCGEVLMITKSLALSPAVDKLSVMHASSLAIRLNQPMSTQGCHNRPDDSEDILSTQALPD